MGALIPGGEEIGCTQANYGGCKGGVQRLGNYPDFARPYGALDMSGNLWEWVSDVYPGTTDYMLKGGDWRTLAWGVRPAVRGGPWDICGRVGGVRYCVLPDSRGLGVLGFRCVLSP